MKKLKNKHIVGLKDIAREAGVAVPTVSLVLNDRTNTFISQATRERVKAIAMRLHYRPKFSHMLIHGRETATVAIIITEATHRADEHIKSLVLLLIERLEREGYSSYTVTLAGNATERVRDLIDRGCGGFVVIGVLDHADTLVAFFRENHVRYIGYNSTLDRNIISDTPAAVEMLLRYFIEKGRTFKMIIDEEREMYAPNSRFRGLKRVYPEIQDDVLRERYVFPLRLITRSDSIDQFMSGYETTRALFGAYPEVNALFYLTDIYALGGTKWLIENGSAVGRDVLVAGFNNTDAVKYYAAPISSGDQNLPCIAAALTDYLFRDNPCEVKIKPLVHLR